MQIELKQAGLAPSPDSEEAAAVVAAVTAFTAEFSSVTSEQSAKNPWIRQALLEATDREPSEPGAWGDPNPWG